MPQQAYEMLYRRGSTVTGGWWLTRWPTLHRLARKIRAVGLVAVLLLPICSTADDFHTCVLHRFPSSRHPGQFSLTVGDDQADHPECAACQWQVTADAKPTVITSHTVLSTLSSWTIEQHFPPPLHLHTSWQERAPPHSSCSSSLL